MMAVLWVAVAVYMAAPVFSLMYLVAVLPRDVRFRKFEHWYAARFELISKRSWYARAWKPWRGCALWGYMITNDAGSQVVRHEGRHCWWLMVAGGYYSLVYGLDWFRLKLFTTRDPYFDNVCERDARAFADRSRNSA